MVMHPAVDLTSEIQLRLFTELCKVMPQLAFSSTHRMRRPALDTFHLITSSTLSGKLTIRSNSFVTYRTSFNNAHGVGSVRNLTVFTRAFGNFRPNAFAAAIS